MSTLKIETPKIFAALLEPSRYKGAYGGRGSGKSHFFAEKLIEDCLEHKGLCALSLRETQKSLAQSSKRLLEAKIRALKLGHAFRIWRDRIETPGDGVIVFVGMADHTAESVKSFEGFQRAWIEEAQAFSHRSLTLLRPTIRAKGSELWASWNPRRKSDAVDEFFRGAQRAVPGAILVKANWRDNPWFPAELEAERRIDLARYPDRYDHIWEGEYAKALEGAYFARELAGAKSEGRIGKIARDPLLPVRAVFDLGGAGASADAMAIWICQWVGHQIRVLDYLEGAGQVLSFYVEELRRRGWGDALCILPHDGVNANAITGKRYEDHLREAGFDVTVIKNQGKGAAMMRIEAARRLFPQIWFDQAATEAGRDALGFYHEKRDEARNVGLGPNHDWSSHAADAFGLMCVAYEEPRTQQRFLDIPAFGAV